MLMNVNDGYKFLVKADQVADYIPIVSSLANLAGLFQKCVVFPFLSKATIEKNHYFSHLNKKSFARYILLLVPGIGNIIVGIYDMKLKSNKDSIKYSVVPSEKSEVDSSKGKSRANLSRRVSNGKPNPKEKISSSKQESEPTKSMPLTTSETSTIFAGKSDTGSSKSKSNPKKEIQPSKQDPEFTKSTSSIISKTIEVETAEISVQDLIDSTVAIDKNFTSNTPIEFQRKAHETSKTWLKEALHKVGAEIDYISHSVTSTPKQMDVRMRELDSDVFRFEHTTGVLGDIKRDGQRADDTEVVYGVASQFNGCEAPGRYTIKPRDAVKVYKGDRTQGPQAQLAFSENQVELINCGGNLGYNGLCKVLDEDTKDQVAHGYFTPSEDKVKEVIEQLQNSGQNIEYPCIAAIPSDGNKKVHQILVAAPAFGMYGGWLLEHSDKLEIQFLCALHGYRAQFEKCIQIAKNSQKSVIFKPTAVGLGAFDNIPGIVASAFYQAASEYQNFLKTNHVTVAFQIYKPEGGEPDEKASFMAEELKLSEVKTEDS